jgi:DNA repair protein RecO (recombination protein O)
METQIIKGIVLSSCDYKEKDKLVELFSVELGRITAVLRGCKAPSAKLKFAFQPFCFAEFSVVKTGKFYQITNASLIDSFFALTTDLSKYYTACILLEVAGVSVAPEEQNPKLFVLLANVLKNICYDGVNEYLATLKFCIVVLEMLGYKISYSKCSVCGLQYTHKIYLNLDSGEFVCDACKNSSAIIIANNTFSCIKIANNTDYLRLNSVKIGSDVARDAIKVVCKNLEYRLCKNIRSIKFI